MSRRVVRTAVIGELSRPASYAAAGGAVRRPDSHRARNVEARAERRSSGDRHADGRCRTTRRRRASGVRRLHVRHVGARPYAGCRHGRRAAQPARRMSPGDPTHEALVLGGSRGGQIRTAVIRPGIVYGGARGIIGDLLKDARNGLLRVVGDGRNHWSCIYDRDLADALRARGGDRRMRRGSSTSTTKPTSAWTTSSTRSHGTSGRASTSGTCRSRKRGRRWAPTRMPWRSIRSSEARAPARWDGRRRCTRWPAMWRVCWKNSAPPAKPRRRCSVRLQPDLRIVEIPPIFVGRPRQKLEKRIEAAIQCAAELRDRAVDRVQSQSGFAVFQPKAGLRRPRPACPRERAGCRRPACSAPYADEPFMRGASAPRRRLRAAPPRLSATATDGTKSSTAAIAGERRAPAVTPRDGSILIAETAMATTPSDAVNTDHAITPAGLAAAARARADRS